MSKPSDNAQNHNAQESIMLSLLLGIILGIIFITIILYSFRIYTLFGIEIMSSHKVRIGIGFMAIVFVFLVADIIVQLLCKLKCFRGKNYSAGWTIAGFVPGILIAVALEMYTPIFSLI
ncbi:MAG: hypothetical protein ACE5KZ_14725 [Candidatus Scalinduaceae bacterium]